MEKEGDKLVQQIRLEQVREAVEQAKRLRDFIWILAGTVPNETACGPVYYTGYGELHKN